MRVLKAHSIVHEPDWSSIYFFGDDLIMYPLGPHNETVSSRRCEFNWHSVPCVCGYYTDSWDSLIQHCLGSTEGPDDWKHLYIPVFDQIKSTIQTKIQEKTWPSRRKMLHFSHQAKRGASSP